MEDEFTRTEEQLKGLETKSAFTKAVIKELRESALDIDILDDYLNVERDKAFKLYKGFSERELRNLSLEEAQNKLINLICDSEGVYHVNERYVEITGKQNDFYNQYSRFMQDVCGKLELEIAYKTKFGGNRNMGDR